VSYKPGDSYYKEFVTSNPTTGAAVNADSLPTATANHNGTDDGSFTLTVTNIDTGRYKITGTIPSGYAAGDVLNVSVVATVSAVVGKAIVDTQVLDAFRLADLASGTGVNLNFGSLLPTLPVANTVGEAMFFTDLLGERVNQAQSGGPLSIQLDSAASSDNNAYIGDSIYLYSGTGGGVRGTGQRRTIVAYDPSSKIATVNQGWDTQPDMTTRFITLPAPLGNVGMWSYAPVASPVQAGVPVTDPHYWSGTVFPSTATAGIPDVNVKNIANVPPTLDSNNALNVSAKYWAGTTINAASIPVSTAAGASGGLLISGTNAGTTTFGAMTISGAMTVGGAMTVSGAVSFGSTFVVSGTTTLTGIVSAPAGIQADITGRLSGSVGSVTNLTNSTIAMTVWQDLITGTDFTTPHSIGAFLTGSTLLDAIMIETGMNLPQAISVIAAACCGQASGVDIGEPIYQAANAPGVTRITATATNGNRSSVLLNLPAI